MEDILASGKARAIGISNAGIPILEHLSKTWKVVPAVNQIENHPYNPEHELKKYCDEKGILIQAYSPLGSTGKSGAMAHAVSRCSRQARRCPRTPF
jgi:glycerol 2-dehydrogenase (NADP+)